MNWWPSVFPSEGFLRALEENERLRAELFALCEDEAAGEAAWQAAKDLSYSSTHNLADACAIIRRRIIAQDLK